MKRIVFPSLIVLFFGAAALAQDLPKIAVYVTGDAGGNEKKALGTRMTTALVKSGRYQAVERSEEFLDKLDAEHVKQRSGAIDDGQISELGRQFGVRFVCVADITPAFGGFQVSVRIINVETAAIDFSGDASSPLKNMNDLEWVSNQAVKKMFGEAGTNEYSRRFKLSVGGGGFFAGDFGGGLKWGDGGAAAMPYYGGGVHIFFDAVYAEIFGGYSAGGGEWKSAAAPTPDALPNMRRTYLNGGVLAKYPFGAGRVKTFPLLGIDYTRSYFGRLNYDGGTDYPFDGNDGRHTSAALSALWVKFGGGVDFNAAQRIYLRSEALYGFRTSNRFEKSNVEKEKSYGSDAKTRLGHGLTVKAGLGINL